MNSRRSSRNPGLDVLRFAAILLVMLRHFPTGDMPDWIMPLANFGWSGVDLFFVLSGYLITRQMVSGMSIGEFYLRRTLRILPPYWLALFLYFYVPWFPERDGIAPLWKFLVFVQNFGLNAATHGAFSHAWSLCVEEHFYFLLCPLIAVTFKDERTRWFLWIMGLVLVVEAIVRGAIWTPRIVGDYTRFLTRIYYPTYVHMDGLVVGAALAVLDRRGTLARVPFKMAAGVGLGLILVAAVLTWNRESYYAAVYGFPVVSLGYGFLVVAALQARDFPGARAATAMAWLAYPAYLIHKPILYQSETIWPAWPLNLISCFILVFLAAAAIHFLVERPSFWLRDRLIQRYYDRHESR